MGTTAAGTAISFLGPLEVVTHGVRREIAGRRERHLLTVLAAEFGRPVGVDRLVDFLWGEDPPRTATKSLQTHVSRLRAMLDLDRDALARRGETYVLDLAAAEVDGRSFRDEVSRARAVLDEDPAAAAILLDRALGRWRAERPADVGTTAAAVAWRRGWVAAWLEAVELRAHACVATGRLDGLAAQLEDLLGRHADRDGLWTTLMAVQAAAGDRTAAVETFHRARRHHAEELGLDPSPSLQEAYERLLRPPVPARASPDAGDGPPRRPAAPGRDRLAGRGRPPPVLAPLLGRDEARAVIERALDGARLVTISGTGGVGKTMLAAELVAERDDVAWVDLVARPVGSDVAGAVLTGVGGTPGPGEPPALAAALLVGRSPLLVVLDNCEHVVDSVREVVTTLLRRCPGVQVLTTSRRPLDLAGERVVHLSPLPVDASGPAARLLGAAVARRGGSVDDVDPARVAELCARLDGLPLALELVAPLVGQLGVEAVAARLDDRFGLLDVAWDATGRARDLGSTVAWSEALLPAPLRPFLRELSVFAGSVDAAAAAAVCASVPHTGTGPDAAAALAALADRSLLEPVRDHPGRYRMLETVREHARRALGGRGLGRAGRNHAQWVASLMDAVAADFLSADEARLAALVDDHLDEIVAAHAWACAEGDADTALRIAVGVAQPMMTSVRGDLAELVADVATTFGASPSPLAAEAWSHLAVWWTFCDRDDAADALDRAAEIARATDAPLSLAWWRGQMEQRLRAYDLNGALEWVARARTAGLEEVQAAMLEAAIVPLEASMGRHEDAGRRARRTHALLVPVGSPTVTALSEAGVAMTSELPPHETTAVLAAAADRARAAGSWFAESIVRMLQAVVAGRTGDDPAAATGLTALLGEWGRRGSWRYEWNTVREGMVVLARTERHEDLLVLLAAGERSDHAPALLGEQEQLLLAAANTATERLGRADAAAARERGAALDDVEASEYARTALLAVAGVAPSP